MSRLSRKFRRSCQANSAACSGADRRTVPRGRGQWPVGMSHLTLSQPRCTMAVLIPVQLEASMDHADEKAQALRAAGAFHPRADAVVDPAFRGGHPFFDRRDLVQVKYEMLRRVHSEGATVTRVAAAFALSRPTFYAAQAAWQAHGLPGLLPARPGPRGGHKLTAEVVAFLADQRAHAPRLPVAQLVRLVQERFGLVVHRRSVERALARHAKGGRR